MPQLLKVGPYLIYFWSNESEPLEPIHVHITDGRPTGEATKIWITSAGKALLCHNKSKIPDRILNRLLRIVEANSAAFQKEWQEHFGEIRFYV